MSKTLILSDIHISMFNRKSTEKVINFLENKINDYEEIFFVGDTFDFYFSYNNFIPKHYVEFFCVLKNLSKHKKVYIIPGNHDLWLDKYFTHIGVNLLKPPYILKKNSKKYCLTHGDEIFDIGLIDKIVKFMIKNKFNVFLFSLLHPEIQYRLGNLISFLTKRADKSKMIEIALSKIGDYPFYNECDMIIIGHVHKAFIDDCKKLAVIGDFKNSGNYIVIDEQGVSFEYI